MGLTAAELSRVEWLLSLTDDDRRGMLAYLIGSDPDSFDRMVDGWRAQNERIAAIRAERAEVKP